MPHHHRKVLYSNTNHSNTITVLLTPPLNDEETCSITLDHIAENPTVHGLKIEHPPLQAIPTHNCIQLDCQHRFNAMALILHFSSNSMTCPMCRSGIEDPLNFFASFPHEPWLDIVHNITLKPARTTQADETIPVRLLFPTVVFQRSLTPDDLRDGPVLDISPIQDDTQLHAKFLMFTTHENDASEAPPIITLQCSLRPYLDRSGYTISPNFSRIISNAIVDLEIQSMSALVFAHNQQENAHVQIATMRRIPIHSNWSEIVAEVSPPIYSITIQLHHQPSPVTNFNNSLFNLLHFHFRHTPLTRTQINML